MVIRGEFEMRKTGVLAMRNGDGFGANTHLIEGRPGFM